MANSPDRSEANAGVYAVRAYLIAKEFEVEWKGEFHRVCASAEFGTKFYNRIILEAAPKVHRKEAIVRMLETVCGRRASIGWIELCEMLNFVKRKRKHRVHRLHDVHSVMTFLKDELGEDGSKESGYVQYLNGNRLSDVDAGTIIEAWRDRRAEFVKPASIAASSKPRAPRGRNRAISNRKC